jgi:hypothetical protein
MVDIYNCTQHNGDVSSENYQSCSCFTMTCNLQKFNSAAGKCTTDVEERAEVKESVMVCYDTSVLHSFENSKTAAATLGESL